MTYNQFNLITKQANKFEILSYQIIISNVKCCSEIIQRIFNEGFYTIEILSQKITVIVMDRKNNLVQTQNKTKNVLLRILELHNEVEPGNSLFKSYCLWLNCVYIFYNLKITLVKNIFQSLSLLVIRFLGNPLFYSPLLPTQKQ